MTVPDEDAIVELRWDNNEVFHTTTASKVGAQAMASGEIWAQWRKSKRTVVFRRDDILSDDTKHVFCEVK